MMCAAFLCVYGVLRWHGLSARNCCDSTRPGGYPGPLTWHNTHPELTGDTHTHHYILLTIHVTLISITVQLQVILITDYLKNHWFKIRIIL